jgi:hypothetical protein
MHLGDQFDGHRGHQDDLLSRARDGDVQASFASGLPEHAEIPPWSASAGPLVLGSRQHARGGSAARRPVIRFARAWRL